MTKIEMNLNDKFTTGCFKGMTLKDAIDKDPFGITNLKDKDIIKIDTKALIYLINTRYDIECRRFSNSMRKDDED